MTKDIEKNTLLGGIVTLFQPKQGYRAGLDAVLLASACLVKAGDAVLDIGCGVGAVSFCLLARQKHLHITGLELDSDTLAVALKNAEANDVEDRFDAVQGDLFRLPKDLKNKTYDFVVSNPPYYDTHPKATSPNPTRRLARSLTDVSLADWVLASAKRVKQKGYLVMIHQAAQLQAMVQALPKGFGGVSLIPIHSKVNEPAHRLIMIAQKDSKQPAQILPRLIVHDATGGYSKAANAILVEGKTIFAAGSETL